MKPTKSHPDMIILDPIRNALVPADSAAADRLSAPNYDEFQSDREIWEEIQARPDNVLRITMAHCDVPSPSEIETGDSDPALARSHRTALSLRQSAAAGTGDVVRVADVYYVYALDDPRRDGVRQIGLGGVGRTTQIRTPAHPDAPIIRNEGIREAKARGRARLIEATGMMIGTVNNAVPDADGAFAAALDARVAGSAPDFGTTDHNGTRHSIWLVPRDAAGPLVERLEAQPEAYVADGNHRSAAAAMLGYPGFLTVFFPAARMDIRPYNRLVDELPPLPERLAEWFDVGSAPVQPYQPTAIHRIGLYDRHAGWRALVPHADAYDPADAAGSIDHAIVQDLLFDRLMGIPDAADERLRFVGANRDAGWLADRVDAGEAHSAVTLPAVTMNQFIAVCRQSRLMPPKSTWFEPKIRSGLVMALLEDP